MKKKTLLIIIGNIFFIILLVALYFFWEILKSTPPEIIKRDSSAIPSNIKPNINITPNPLPVSENKEPLQTNEPKMTIRAQNNTSIAINDFYKSPTAEIIDPQKDAYIVKTERYNLVYITVDQSFIISLFGEDFQVSRDVAEKEFLNKLGITKDQACQLRVSVGVRSTDMNIAGKEYGLSFCPNSRPVPN